MTLFYPLRAGAVATLLVASPAAMTQNLTDPFTTVPYRNPAPLEQLLSLDEQRFGQAAAANHGQDFRAIVTPFDPPRSSRPRVSLSFAGVRAECLDDVNVLACRLYVAELLKVHRQKEGRGANMQPENR